MAHSRLRRSISCMVAGLLIVVPATVFFWGTLAEWYPPGIVIVILAALCIAGIIWLYDEIRDIRAEAKRASAASEKLLYQIRAWNPEQPHQENVIMSRAEQKMTPDEQVAFSARLLSEGFIMPMIEAGFNAWDIAASLARAAGECCSDADQLKALHEILASGYSIAQRDVARRS